MGSKRRAGDHSLVAVTLAKPGKSDAAAADTRTLFARIAQSGIDTTSQRSRFDVGAPRSGGIGLFRASTMRPRKGAVTPLAKTAVD